ncbi:BrnA antitoxin family protein [bacterium]|nr:BrnA antitoxin family protein [bacterium]
MRKAKKQVPLFTSEQEEFDFCSTQDSMDYLNDTEEIREKLELTKRKLPKQRITMLLDPRLKLKLERIAAEKGIPYQTLIQLWLRERVNQEIKRKLAS